MITRRTLIGSAASAGIVVLSGTSAATTILSSVHADIGLQTKIISSLPVQGLGPDGVPINGKVLGFLLHKRSTDPETNGIEVKKHVIDSREHYDLSEIFSDDFEQMESKNDSTPGFIDIIRASNKIARKSMRGKGTHYAVFSDHVLVWYAGSVYDSPLSRVGSNVLIHPDYKNYFVKVMGVSLSDEDHEKLSKLNYTRIEN